MDPPFISPRWTLSAFPHSQSSLFFFKTECSAPIWGTGPFLCTRLPPLSFRLSFPRGLLLRVLSNPFVFFQIARFFTLSPVEVSAGPQTPGFPPFFPFAKIPFRFPFSPFYNHLLLSPCSAIPYRRKISTLLFMAAVRFFPVTGSLLASYSTLSGFSKN